MKLRIAGVALLMALLTTLASAAPQQRKSPHETVSAVIDGQRVIVVYGRPFTKDPKTGEPRKIWGGLVPWDKVWRTGADEATLLITQAPLVIGENTIPAGAYSLYTIPSESGDTVLIVNKAIGQWGLQYDQKQDLARIPLKKSSLDAPVDQFTIAIDKATGGGGTLTLSWESTAFSVPFSVKK